MTEWMTRREAADYLRISVTQLNRLKLPRTILGRSPRYSRVTLDLHLQRGMFTPPATNKKGGPSMPPPVSRYAVGKWGLSLADRIKQLSPEGRANLERKGRSDLGAITIEEMREEARKMRRPKRS